MLRGICRHRCHLFWLLIRGGFPSPLALVTNVIGELLGRWRRPGRKGTPCPPLETRFRFHLMGERPRRCFANVYAGNPHIPEFQLPTGGLIWCVQGENDVTMKIAR